MKHETRQFNTHKHSIYNYYYRRQNNNKEAQLSPRHRASAAHYTGKVVMNEFSAVRLMHRLANISFYKVL